MMVEVISWKADHVRLLALHDAEQRFKARPQLFLRFPPRPEPHVVGHKRQLLALYVHHWRLPSAK